MFGDHQPSDYITNVIAKLTGYNADTSLEEAQKSYLVPYVVWSNFDLDMEERPLVSVNYLAADVLEAAKLPLTVYQKFLLKQQETIPAIAAGAFVDEQGGYHSYEQKAEYEDLLNEYQILQYNHLTDVKNRDLSVFTLNQEEK